MGQIFISIVQVVLELLKISFREMYTTPPPFCTPEGMINKYFKSKENFLLGINLGKRCQLFFKNSTSLTILTHTIIPAYRLITARPNHSSQSKTVFLLKFKLNVHLFKLNPLKVIYAGFYNKFKIYRDLNLRFAESTKKDVYS